MTPRVLIVGAGSAGRRHIRNLLALGAEVSAVRERVWMSEELEREFGIWTFASLGEALDAGPTAVVVCNRTDQHLGTSLEAARRGCHLYVEKPLAMSLEGIGELQHQVRTRGLVVEVGCMLRFHPNLVMLKRLLDDGAIGAVRFAHAFVGQHLADWRPGQDYRSSYSARRDQGGGVLLDLVHEIDYLLWCLGLPSEVFAFLEHLSNLETDAEDTAELLLRFEEGVLAHVHLDCLRPVYGRGCEIVGAAGVLSWDYTEGTVMLQRRESHEPQIFRQPAEFEHNSMFVAAMKAFLKRIECGGQPTVSLEDGIRVLVVVAAARKSSVERRAVAVREVYVQESNHARLETMP